MRTRRSSPRIVLGAFATALAHPRLLLLAWLLVTVPALLAVAPAYAAMDRALSHHPGAGYYWNEDLDADLLRLAPGFSVQLTGALLFVLVAWVALSGGVLATAGTGTRFRLRSLLHASATTALRSLRVLLLALPLFLLLGWGLDAFDAWLHDRLADRDPGPFLPFRALAWFGWPFVVEAVAWARGFLFLLLLFLAKLALARLVSGGRESALLAWLRSFGSLLRHPLRIPLTVAGLCLVWALGQHLLGLGTAYFLDGRQQLWLGLAFGQAGVLWTQAALVAFLLAARAFVPTAPVVVELPADEPEPEPAMTTPIPA
jgi:hypothetical protein